METYKNEKFLSWVREQPCMLCRTEEDITAHHRQASGMGGGKRDDFTAVPLCAYCHNLVHNYEKDFKKRYGDTIYKYMRNQYE